MNKRPEKTNDDKSKNTEHEELRQQLWELAYGLLDTDAEAALTAQIKSDPAVARLYSEVKLQTDLVSAAARVEDSSLNISAGDATAGITLHGKKEKSRNGSKSAAKVAADAKNSGAWGTNWLAVVGTTALLLLLGYGLWQPDTVTSSVAQGEYYYTRVTGLTSMTEGVTQTISVESKDIQNNGRSAKFDVRLIDAAGRETYRTQVRTADDGRADVELPGAVLKKGVRLEVTPADPKFDHDRSGEVVAAKLQVADEKRRTVLLLEKPFVHPGEKSGFQMFSIGDFTKEIAPPATDELMVENQSGRDVVQPMWNVDPQNGLIRGEFELPQTYSKDEELAMRRRATKQQADGRALNERALDERDAVNKLPVGGGVGGGGLGGGADVERRQLDRGSLPRGANGARSAADKATEKMELQRAGEAGGKIVLRSADDAKSREAEKDLAATGDSANGKGATGGGANATTGGPGASNVRSMPYAAGPAAPAVAPGGAPRPGAAPALAGGEGGSKRKNMADSVAGDRPLNDDPAITDPGAKSANNAPAAPAPAAPAPAPLAPAPLAPAPLPPAPAALDPATPAPLVQDGQEEGKPGERKVVKPQAASPPPAPPGESAGSEVEAAALGQAKQAKGVAQQNSQEQTAANRFQEKKSAERKTAEELTKSLKEIEVPVPADARGQDLVLVARQGGRIVSRRELPSYEKAVVTVDLPPEVNGLVEVELLRKSNLQAPLFREQVVRTSQRALLFEVAGLKDSYAPGEKVQLSVRVVDEQNKPAAAAVGVRVWNDEAARSKGGPLLLVDDLSREQASLPAEQTELLAAATGPAVPALKEAAKQNALARKSMADGPEVAPPDVAPPAPVNDPLPPAEDQALSKAQEKQSETRDLQQLPAKSETGSEAATEVFFADNRAVVEQEYERAVAMDAGLRAERARYFGRILLWSGAGLMLLIGVLLMSRRPLKSAIWIPAVGVAALSLGLGIAWFLPPPAEPQQLARLEKFEAQHTTAGKTVETDRMAIDRSEGQLAPLPADVQAPPLVAPAVRPAEPATPKRETLNPSINRPGDLVEAAPGQAAPGVAPAPPAPGEPLIAIAPFNGGGGQGGGSAPLPAAADSPQPGEKPRGQAEGESLAEPKFGANAEAMKRVEQSRQADTKPSTADSLEPANPQAKKFDANRAAGLPQSAGFGLSAGITLPDSLFWRPLSPIASDGTFTIEFTMPAAESDYRLLIDAIGSGRIGGKEQILRVRAE